MKYYQIIKGQIDGSKSTEKATAIIIGDNGCITKQHRYFYEFIANSQIKTIDNNYFVPAWLAKKISAAIDWNNYIDIKEEKKQSKPKKTKEEKDLEEYNSNLRSYFLDWNLGLEGKIPSEYIEYWFEGFDANLSNARFTTVNKLQKIIEFHDEEIIKINIVRNGQRENIRG